LNLNTSYIAENAEKGSQGALRRARLTIQIFEYGAAALTHGGIVLILSDMG
jgi:hypothetical protein